MSFKEKVYEWRTSDEAWQMKTDHNSSTWAFGSGEIKNLFISQEMDLKLVVYLKFTIQAVTFWSNLEDPSSKIIQD